MALSGDVETLSLADLTQVSAASRRTCRVLVNGAGVSGEIYIERGELVHALYGELVGDSALYAMLAAPDAQYQVETGIKTQERSIFLDAQQLILEAARRQDEGITPTATPTGPPMPFNAHRLGQTAVSRPTGATGTAHPSMGSHPSIPSMASHPSMGSHPSIPSMASHPSMGSHPSIPSMGSHPSIPSMGSHPSIPSMGSHPSIVTAGVPGTDGGLRDSAPITLPPLIPAPGWRDRPRMLFLGVAGLVAAAVVVSVKLATPTIHRLPPAAATAAPPAPPIEAAQLTGAGDSLPVLVDGTPPRTPNPSLALSPTVVCRLLVDTQGRVAESRIYRSRLDLAAFEDAALQAVQSYRFTPARKAGLPVAAWVNWPVTFTSAVAGEQALVRIKGSDTIGGALGPDLAKAYMAQHPNTRVTVEALGTATAFAGLFDGSADLGAASRPVNEAELAEARRLGVSLEETVIGYDGIAVIVHPSSRVPSLTIEQLSRLFTGTVRNWRELGGTDLAVKLIGRPTYSGTHSFFKEKVLRRGNAKGPEEFAANIEVEEKNQEIVRKVAADPGAVAYVGLGWVTQAVRALPVSSGGPAVVPERATVRNGTYPIYRPLLLYTRGTPHGETATFLRFALSRAGQEQVMAHGFVAGDTPDGVAAAASVASTGQSTPSAAPEVMRIFFEHGDSGLGHDARRTISELAGKLLAGGGVHALVIGHADAEGDRESNRRVSLARAERVASLLEHEGVPASQLEVQADSADLPLASNRSTDGRRQNRRVDVFLIGR
jgi:phosphate binding protein